ncbi:uncharacterized protein C8Q71DRAFT_324218 [Rhodofomes roseus]|uniref:Uncharacterized protein n=1 Tax=Rhodofomes roseus TaxID=34475 RepID=A0ABQ8K281_9APHY|nr:uncharacterized protein C8Q71DRAFT_324218 [Rhodofomes roseus]KAH9830845.1 hypothetical protein C8Q71DRAFT_324218 [Rhodofomes roseus]
MLAERSLRPLPLSPAQSRPPSPRDLLPLSASRATPSRPLPLPAPLTRSQSSASLNKCRPLPVPPGEVDALAPLRRLSVTDASNSRTPPTRPTLNTNASPTRPAVRPLPTPISPNADSTAPLSGSAFAPTSWRQASDATRGRSSTSASAPGPLLDDFECFGIRPTDVGASSSPGHVAKAKSEDLHRDDRDRPQRRLSQKAALAIIARDRVEQEEAWRALLAKKGNQHGRL